MQVVCKNIYEKPMGKNASGFSNIAQLILLRILDLSMIHLILEFPVQLQLCSSTLFI